MTQALCLNCGSMKFGAICTCPNCRISSCGNYRINIAFSDQTLSEETLKQLGEVLKIIIGKARDPDFVGAAFSYFVYKNFPEFIRINIESDKILILESFLETNQLPAVNFEYSEKYRSAQGPTAKVPAPKKKKKWWSIFKK